MHFKVSAVLPIDARTFLVERDSAAFRALVAHSQNLGALEIRDGWSDGNVQVFKLVTKPDINHFVPKRLQHYLPSNTLEYTDIIRYDPALLQAPPFVLQVHSVPPVFAKKTSIECTLTIAEVDDKSCCQTLEGDITIKVMGLGSIAERIICSSLRDVYSGIPQIVERWNAFRDEVLKQPEGRERLFEGRPPLTEHWVSDQVERVMRAPYDDLAQPRQPCPQPALQDSQPIQQPAASSSDLRPGSTLSQQQQQQQQMQQVHLKQQAGGVLQPPVASSQQPDLPQDDPSVASRNLSIAVFEGDTFYTPDDIPGGLDEATAAQMRADQQEAEEWFRVNKSASQHLAQNGISATESGSPAAPQQQQAREQQRQQQSAEWWVPGEGSRHAADVAPPDSRATGADVGEGVVEGACYSITNARNLPHWEQFWRQTDAAKQQVAPAAAHRLTGLYHLAVRRGLDQPGMSDGATSAESTTAATVEQPMASPGQGASALPDSPLGNSSPGTPLVQTQSQRRSGKSVGFRSPVVNGIHEADPTVDEADPESVHSKKFCFCFSKPASPRFHYK